MTALTPDQRFARCLAVILREEGGWSDDPRDPGGATNHGITLAVYREFYGATRTKADLRAIAPEQVAHIYRARYWGATCDALPPGLDLMYFNAAVNCGPLRARRWLVVTPQPSSEVAAQIRTYAAAQEAYYRGLNTFATYGHGWINRLHAVTALALSWALNT